MKPQGKSRIDCWHKDKDTNTVIYGNKEKKSRKSLLKKSSNKQSNQKLSHQGSNYIGGSSFKTPLQKFTQGGFEDDDIDSIIPDENDFGGQSEKSPVGNNINFYPD